MNALGFRIEMRPNAAGYEIGWLVEDNGRERRASPEEITLWQVLERLQYSADTDALEGKARGRKVGRLGAMTA